MHRGICRIQLGFKRRTSCQISKDSPGVVAFAQYHAAFEVEAPAHVRERLPAARALQTPVVPVSVERV